MKILKIIALLLCLSVCFACGKKALPQPKNVNQSYSWKLVDANFVNNECINFSGEIEGAHEYIDSFLLEIEPETEDICINCPFTPTEGIQFEANLGESSEKIYTFLHCPSTKANSYRWRLIAKHVNPTYPSVLSPVGLVQSDFPIK